MGRWTPALASESRLAKPFDLVAIKNGDPLAMFDAGIAALGGIGNFVKANQTVVVKPNIGWDASPERAANTNPDLIGHIIKQCYYAGAKKVMVFDHTCDEWTRCYKNSGIEKAVKDNGGQIVTGMIESDYKEVDIPKGVTLKKARVHKLILESDVFLNVPVLKHHGGATISLSMKNLMGIVWDRRFWHKNDLHQCIADFATIAKPDLNIVDGYRVLMRNGPRGVSVADVDQKKYQLMSSDMVAIDTAASKIFGIEADRVKHIGLAEGFGVGTTKLNSLNIKRISI